MTFIRLMLVVGWVLCLGGCKESKPQAAVSEDHPIAEAEAFAVPLPASTLPTAERDRLIELAEKVLGFIKNKDGEALVLMASSDGQDRMKKSLEPGAELHKKLFDADGWGWKTVDGWDEKIDGIRIFGEQARAKYAETGDGKAVVLVFRKVEGVWGFEDVQSLSADEYASWGKPAQ